MRLCIALICLIFFSACTPKAGGDRSTISLSIPTLNQLNAKGSLQKVSSLGVNASSVRWEDACFMVSVTARDIEEASHGACDLPSGIFKGSVPASTDVNTQTLTLENVPKGELRRFDVYAYFHTTGETCPAFKSLNQYDKSRVARLGFAENVAIQKDVESVVVDISLPTQMIAAEAHLPASCAVAAKSSVLRGVAGTQSRQVTTLNYTVSTSVGGSNKRVSLTGNGYKVYRKRGTAQ